MRTCFAALAGLLSLTLSSFAQYGGGYGASYVIKSVSPAVWTSPEISYTLGPQHPQGQARQWLEVEVDFQSYVPWTDELTFKYYILLTNRCLTGQVTHVDIPKGQDLYSVMYVPPRTIQQILNGRPLDTADIVDVGVQILNQGQVVATKSYKAYGQSQWWQNMQQVNGKVLNKNQTPFAGLFWDRYEQIKSTSDQQ
ncbi:MAG: Amuc_1102 family pilus-like protein [Chthoniobacteraceae bacterium]|jgi:hypothetical protein